MAISNFYLKEPVQPDNNAASVNHFFLLITSLCSEQENKIKKMVFMFPIRESQCSKEAKVILSVGR